MAEIGWQLETFLTLPTQRHSFSLFLLSSAVYSSFLDFLEFIYSHLYDFDIKCSLSRYVQFLKQLLPFTPKANPDFIRLEQALQLLTYPFIFLFYLEI